MTTSHLGILLEYTLLIWIAPLSPAIVRGSSPNVFLNILKICISGALHIRLSGTGDRSVFAGDAAAVRTNIRKALLGGWPDRSHGTWQKVGSQLLTHTT